MISVACSIRATFEIFHSFQDIDVLAQLIYGVRYLDIRVGHYPLTNEIWWANHGVVPLIPLKVVIEQVKEFLDNTEEIVIFDVQEFPIGNYYRCYIKCRCKT